MAGVRRILSVLLIAVILNCICFSANAVKTTATARCSAEEEQYIWDFFKELTGNAYGAAGIVGNLYYESHLLPQNLEELGHKPPRFDSCTYAEAVDWGYYEDFANDNMGFGLAQWTFPARKQRLLDLAKQQGRSVGSLDVQLDLVAEELRDYNMLGRLSAAEEVNFASDYVMTHFENPKDQSLKLKKERRKVCKMFYEKYALGNREAIITDAQALVVSIAKHSDEYKIKATPGYCQAWVADVYKAAGFKLDTSHSAMEAADRFSVSDDLTQVPVGATVYGHSSSEFGHVGIYVGKGRVYHITDKVVSDSLEDWIKTYDGFCWGWAAGVDLSRQP